MQLGMQYPQYIYHYNYPQCIYHYKYPQYICQLANSTHQHFYRPVVDSSRFYDQVPDLQPSPAPATQPVPAAQPAPAAAARVYDEPSDSSRFYDQVPGDSTAPAVPATSSQVSVSCDWLHIWW